ncbi:MAG: family 20 glycosylhydrolase, partial [Flavobacteriales bacterium]|nr:family 20 glycosylhydrolase [Flavobacteriales bacterium]
MKRPRNFFLTPWFAVALLLVSCGPDDARLKGGVEGLIPAPQSVTLGGRPFECQGTLRVEWPAEWGAEQAVVQAWLEDAGIALDSNASPTLRFSLSGPEAGREAYRIMVESGLVTVESASSEGLFRGWITLRKMLPLECETGCAEGFVLPGVRVEDAPALEHRGLLLDGCRHFQDVAFVKKQIDVLALHGMNVLHWHL